jgi:hypothetical protein
MSTLSPVHPDKRTSANVSAASAKCQERTSWLEIRSIVDLRVCPTRISGETAIALHSLLGFYERSGLMAWSACVEKVVAQKVEDLVHAAFEKSWQFVSTDPILARGDIEELRTRLSTRLSRLAQNGERDIWRLANIAIGELRRELTAA